MKDEFRIPNCLVWFFVLLDPDCRKWLFGASNGDLGRFKTAWCRLRGHPEGVVYYSSGYEPDMHCVNCNDDLG